MGKTRTCILCDIVYSSRKEMDDHMRSMLHHRELENLKGRDSGHECRTCGVTVASLTEYADHISSGLHKQRVEAHDIKASKEEQDEEYFDKDMVELIEKRKNLIRQEEAALKRSREEEKNTRKWQDLEETWQGPRIWPHKPGSSWGQPCPNFPRGRGAGNWNSWQNRSATWHAEGPPNLQNWGLYNGRGGSLHNQGHYWDGRSGYYGVCPPQQMWHGQDASQRHFHWSRGKGFDKRMPPPNHYTGPPRMHPHQKEQHSLEGQKKGNKGQNVSGGENDQVKSNSSKQLQSYRWAPYPPAKLGDPSCQSGTQPASESPGSSLQSNEKHLSAHSHGDEQDNQHGPSEQQQEKQHQKQKTCLSKSSESGGKSLKQTCPTLSSSSSTSQKAQKPTKRSEKRVSTNPGSVTNLSRAASQDSVSSKASNHSHTESLSSQNASCSPEQERLLSEMLRKAKENLLDKRGGAGTATSEDCPEEPELHTSKDPTTRNPTVNRSKKLCNSGRKSAERNGRKERLDGSASQLVLTTKTDTSPSLQSLQVSTSTEYREEEEGCGEGDEDPVRDCEAVDDGLGLDGEGGLDDQPQVGGNSVPPLSKLALPACLKRDLNRHIGGKGKAAAVREPNLNGARRIRNVSGNRKGEGEKDVAGLKPTLRQLISSSASRRSVNWDQVYQEVHRKKQEKGKGLPRFGIEMVPSGAEGPSHMEEDDVPLCEGFQWDALVDFDLSSVPSRKRSMSESAVVNNGPGTSPSLLTAQEPGREASVSGQQHGSRLTPQPVRSPLGDCSEGLAQDGVCPEVPGPGRPAQDPEPLDGDSSCISGAELNDFQTGGKKRRAAGDVVSPEIPNSGRKNKRQKVKLKRESLELDELLAVSLREEVLNGKLQTLDSDLVHARATLQAAYMEVQRLLMVKQEVTTEMDSLRTRRIEILQGLKSDLEPSQKTRGYDEEPTATAVLAPPSTPPSKPAPESAVHPSHTATSSPMLPPPPPAASSTPAVSIKGERASPVALTPARNQTNSPRPGPHSTTPEQAAAIGTETGSNSSLMVKEGCQNEEESAQDGTGIPLSTPPPDHRVHLSPAQPTPTASQESQQGPSPPPVAVSPPLGPPTDKPCPPPTIQDTKAGKRVRKLKKKRVLRKAQGAEQPDATDSELDADRAPRPVRKLRSRRKTSNSCPSPPVTEEMDESMEVAGAAEPMGTKEPTPAPPSKEAQDSDSSELEMVELPQAMPTEVVNLDSSDTDEGVAEERTDPPPQVSEEHADEKTEAQKLACNEVTSTSEMDTSSAAHSCQSEKKTSLVVVKEQVFSDASSDPGEEEVPTEGSFEGHQEAVNGMQIHNGLLYTCSGDRTVRAFNLTSRKCMAVFEGHSSKVNCVLVSSGPGLQQRLYSGSSDQTVRCFNIKTRKCVQQLSLPDRVLCLHSRWKVLYVGLANGCVVTFSLKTNKQLDVFDCHGPRAVSCLATAQEGARRVLLVGSYDSTISVRDAKSGLLLRTLEGHTKTVLCMKVVNDLVFSGSSDQSVHAHNIHTGELVRIYKGHSHAVTVVAILGKVMVTACLDKLVRVYELHSHDRLQVYGGHSDMVMCMLIHKSMIYTGCYDGSVKAVRLNLIQNYRCWWHGCSLIFGVTEHLQQHLLSDHVNPTQKMLKCRWRNCESFFTSRSSKQVQQAHMQKHAEEDSKIEP
ncbi:zinc finger protein 106 [Brachyhypopomus gauderio]|uniref:zinc finger protein 106 n=1 Tax=Brachyhypopomus gauderio TaxID=698409 RepID=UPI004041DDFE